MSVRAAAAPLVASSLHNDRASRGGDFASAGGERGIRTPGTLARPTVFKTAAFNRSAISPCGNDSIESKLRDA